MRRPVRAARELSALAFALALPFGALACGGAEKERDASVALALLLDNQERCAAVADEVATVWTRAGSSPRAALADYYAGEGAEDAAAATRALELIEGAMQPVGRTEGEVRELLLELYAAHSRLCELALSSAGLSLEAFGGERAELRGEFAGLRARLAALLPLSEAERRELSGPFEAEVAAARAAAAAAAPPTDTKGADAAAEATFEPDPEVERMWRETEIQARELEHRRELGEAQERLEDPDFERRLDEWYRLYRRQFVPVASCRAELELPLKLRGLTLVMPDCQRLLEATHEVNRVSLLTAPDERINGVLGAAVDLFQRAALSCTGERFDLAYETFRDADTQHREAARLISLYGLDPGP